MQVLRGVFRLICRIFRRVYTIFIGNQFNTIKFIFTEIGVFLVFLRIKTELTPVFYCLNRYLDKRILTNYHCQFFEICRQPVC